MMGASSRGGLCWDGGGAPRRCWGECVQGKNVYSKNTGAISGTSRQLWRSNRVCVCYYNIIIASRSAIIWLNDCVLKVWIFSWYIRRSGVVKVSIIIFRCDACNFRFKDLALLWIIFNEWFLNIRSVIRFWILYGWKLKVFWSICLIDIIGVVSFKRSICLFNHINIEAKT